MLRAALTALLLLGVGTAGDARADRKVDWSDYLEPPGARPIPVKHDDPAPQEAPTRAASAQGKATKAKTAESRAKAKPKAKAKAKRGARRR